MYLNLEVTILYVIQMSNEVHLIDLPRFTAISREWKTIGQILKNPFKTVSNLLDYALWSLPSHMI